MSFLANSAVIATGESIDTGDIDHSLRFRKSASANLSRTFGAPTDNTSWALSMFVKRGTLSAVMSLFSAGNSEIFFPADNTLRFYKDGAAVATSTALFRDPTSHGHLFIRSNGTNVKAYWNTVEVLSYTGTIPDINSAILHTLGKYAASATEYFDGYLSRIAFVDGGGSLTPTDFVRFNSETNEWVSKTQSEVKALVDAGGNNSTMLEFDDATSLTTLGHDKSTHGNHWTLNNFSLTAGVTYDHMLDVPGNNYATLNTLDKHANFTLTEGNLSLTGVTANVAARSSFFVSSGKWYWEYTKTAASGNDIFGILKEGGALANYIGGTIDGYGYGAVGYRYNNGPQAAYGASLAVNDVIGAALDMDAGTLTFYKNGTTQGVAFSSLSGRFSPAYSVGVDCVAKANFGQRPFSYTPPTGFKALCQANMPSDGTVITSGTFAGNASADGPCVWMNGVPKTLSINGNAVTFGTHADKLATGFKVRSAAAAYNASGSNTWTATIDSDLQNIFKYNNAEGNP